MSKQAIVIFHEEKPIIIAELKSFVDSTEFIKKREECKANMNEILKEQKAKDERIARLEKQLANLEHEINVLKGVE